MNLLSAILHVLFVRQIVLLESVLEIFLFDAIVKENPIKEESILIVVLLSQIVLIGFLESWSGLLLHLRLVVKNL